MSQREKASVYTPSGFFVLRTPLLPFDELSDWSEGLEAVRSLDDHESLKEALGRDRARLRDRLLGVLTRPDLRQAIFVASPNLDEAFEVWLKEPDSKRGRKVEPALVAYFSRAAARATPFGLFAGCTTGTIGSRTRLELQARQQYESHSRLDMDYLWALAEALERDPHLRRAFVYEPNSSLYEAAGRLHLTQGRVAASRRSYHLVAIDKDPYLTATLARAEGGATLDDLAEALVDDEITRSEAEKYVAELVDSQILVADVRPAVTGEEPVHGLVATLARKAETARLGKQLDEARALLATIDAQGLGVHPDRYRTTVSLISELPAQAELSRLVQVDLIKPCHEITLGSQIASEISHGVRILHLLASPRSPDSLSQFQEEFLERYETREVPLVEALDEETGIGFEASNSPLAEASPLLNGLPLPTDDEETESWSGRHELLLNKLAGALAKGANEVTLEASDLDKLSSERKPPLPDAFYVMASVAAESEEAMARGEFRVLLHHAEGPSGAQLLGRFCHTDQELHDFVRTHLEAEEACHPERVYAEIAHLPEGRIGNILCRPVLRGYEIPYLGRSGAPICRQIPITDLLVSVRGDRIVLRSRRLGREVVPRLTTAHNYSWGSLGVYRFLCILQHQDVLPWLGWDWGPLEQAPFLPRVVTGRLVLSRARWKLDQPELRMLAEAGNVGGFATVQAWRAEQRLPRHVALRDDDNELMIDLENVLSLEALAHQLRGRSEATLVEMFPGPGELCVSGPEGAFVHEVVVPFIRSRPAEEPDSGAALPTAGKPVRRRFSPGSEWVYAKLYGGPATADQVLGQMVHPVVEAASASGAADSWFFIRYGDPAWHLRLRFHGQAERLHAEVLPLLQAAAAPLLDSGQLWRVQLDTYEREVERYGGERGIELAEEIFRADSEAVLAIVRSLSGDAGLDLRWRLALRGIDLLFDDLGLTLDEKRFVARESRESFGREFGVDGNFRGEVGQRFRSERASLEALFDAGREPEQLAPGLEALRRRSLQIAPLTAELRQLARGGHWTLPMTDLAMSYAHMHVNRLLRSAQRAQELVLYEFLERIYTSQAARRSPSG